MAGEFEHENHGGRHGHRRGRRPAGRERADAAGLHDGGELMRRYERGLMKRLARAATMAGLALTLLAGVALAEETTGRVTGRVTDRDTGAPMGGVTVIVQGPQGEDATLTNDKGEYNFTTLPVGGYTIRFYA